MAKQRSTFDKLQRARAKQAKAAAKRERRMARPDEAAPEQDAPEERPAPAGDENQVLAALAALHQSYDDGAIGLEDFEARRDELRARLQID
jgi:hypothetical protein